MEILDSGSRTEFPSGAVRDVQADSKGRCDLLPLDVVAVCLRNPVIIHLAKFQEDGDTQHLYDALDAFCIQRHFTDKETMVLEVAIHMAEGAKKYSENNWRLGIPAARYLDSSCRHLLKHLRGDEDEPHARAFCWNVMCCIWTCKNKPWLNDYAGNEGAD